MLGWLWRRSLFKHLNNLKHNKQTSFISAQRDERNRSTQETETISQWHNLNFMKVIVLFPIWQEHLAPFLTFGCRRSNISLKCTRRLNSCALLVHFSAFARTRKSPDPRLFQHSKQFNHLCWCQRWTSCAVVSPRSAYLIPAHYPGPSQLSGAPSPGAAAPDVSRKIRRKKLQNFNLQ